MFGTFKRGKQCGQQLCCAIQSLQHAPTLDRQRHNHMCWTLVPSLFTQTKLAGFNNFLSYCIVSAYFKLKTEYSPDVTHDSNNFRCLAGSPHCQIDLSSRFPISLAGSSQLWQILHQGPYFNYVSTFLSNVDQLSTLVSMFTKQYLFTRLAFCSDLETN